MRSATDSACHHHPQRSCERSVFAGWLRVLLLFLVALPVFADGGDGGGDGGVINLPNARNNVNRCSSWRMRVTRDDYRPGIVLRMPQELQEGCAFFEHERQLIPITFTDGEFSIGDETLEKLRGTEVYKVDMTIVGKDSLVLLVAIELERDGYGFTITVW